MVGGEPSTIKSMTVFTPLRAPAAMGGIMRICGPSRKLRSQTTALCCCGSTTTGGDSFALHRTVGVTVAPGTVWKL